MKEKSSKIEKEKRKKIGKEKYKDKIECTVDGVPSQIPIFDPPITPSPTLGAWPEQQNENSVQYVFYLLFVRTHTKIGIKILELTW